MHANINSVLLLTIPHFSFVWVQIETIVWEMIKVVLSISSSYTQFTQFVQDLVKNASKFISQSHTMALSLGDTGSQSKSAIHLSIDPRSLIHAMWLFVYTSKSYFFHRQVKCCEWNLCGRCFYGGMYCSKLFDLVQPWNILADVEAQAVDYLCFLR